MYTDLNPHQHRALMEQMIEKATRLIADAEHLLITAGAGMGVDSGLPDFRGNDGFWKAHPCYKNENLGFQDLANPEWFSHDIARAWGFYGYRFQLYQKTVPHQGYNILKQWSEHKDHFIFTSNVDGAFQKAGFKGDRINECHGSLNHFQCADCDYYSSNHGIWTVDELPLNIDESTMTATGVYPRCPQCNAYARPNILMFGDYSWADMRQREQHIRYQKWLKNVDNNKLVVIEMGAGGAIPTVRSAGEAAGGTMIRINPDHEYANSRILHIQMGALSALDKINTRLQAKGTRLKTRP